MDIKFCCSANLFFFSVFAGVCADGAIAQSITPTSVTPALDGTGTVVTVSDAPVSDVPVNALQDAPPFNIEVNIEGGSLSDNGENLFHSFQSFHLQAGEQANFLTAPTVESVFARVNGGSPTWIDGQLQVLGSEAHLFLMNPAGVLFGSNAVLNLPGNFTATTANALEIGDRRFNAMGDHNYASLNGSLSAFAFTDAIPGAIVNGGKLSLGPQQQLSLVGGSVINTGVLSTSGGIVTVAAVPGENIARIHTEGQLLTLDLVTDELMTDEPMTDESVINELATEVGAHSHSSSNSSLNTSNASPFSLLQLPELLTNASGSEVTQLIQADDGTVRLVNSEPSISDSSVLHQSGTTIVSGVIDVSESAGVGGQVSVLGDRVTLLNAQVDASGSAGGGTVLLGGNYRGQGVTYRASQTLIDEESAIAANALHDGNGGRVITWADEITQFLGQIAARGAGEGDGGLVEVSGKEHLRFQGAVDVSAPSGRLGSLLLDPRNIRIVNGLAGENDARLSDNKILQDEGSSNFTLSEETLESLSGNANVTLEATNSIVVEDLADDALTFASGTGEITWLADADNDGSGDIVFQDTSDELVAEGRSLSLSGNRLVLGTLRTADSAGAGDITLQATQSLNVGRLRAQSSRGEGGNVSVISESDIATGLIHTAGLSASGNVTLTSTQGGIATADILTETFGNSATVTLSTPTNYVIGNVTANALTVNGEALETFEGEIDPKTAVNLTSRTRIEDIRAEASRPKPASSHGPQKLLNSTRTTLDSAAASEAVTELETTRVQEFSDYFGRSLQSTDITPAQIQSLLTEVHAQTGNQSVVVYIKAPVPTVETALEILLFTANTEPISITVPNLTHAQLQQTITEFRDTLVTSLRRQSTTYLSPAQQLYQWLITPIENAIESELGSGAIDTILFSMDTGLRSIPIAALHDGEQFLVEKYSVGMVPSLSLMDTDYQPMESAQVLAMGASSFETLQPLAAVPTEIETISQLWQSRKFINEAFTRHNLIEQQAKQPAQIIHLATHAVFNEGRAENSYIQLWNEQLYLSDIHLLGWGFPAIDLLVLSACQTALGNVEAEMGFAGLAVASGAKSALASLWSVSDVGTLALMGEFYDHLRTTPIKAEALRQAQLAMLRQDIRVESGQLLNTGTRNVVPLPSALHNNVPTDLSHPYYWAGFTLIGSPW